MKIRDKERAEPPHVTVIRGCKSWRFGLREMEFLDKEPDPGSVPEEVVHTIQDKRQLLVDEWDKMYPNNSVGNAA